MASVTLGEEAGVVEDGYDGGLEEAVVQDETEVDGMLEEAIVGDEVSGLFGFENSIDVLGAWVIMGGEWRREKNCFQSCGV